MNKGLFFIGRLNMISSLLVLILITINVLTINNTWFKGFCIGIDFYIIVTSLACLIYQYKENKRIKKLYEEFKTKRHL